MEHPLEQALALVFSQQAHRSELVAVLVELLLDSLGRMDRWALHRTR